MSVTVSSPQNIRTIDGNGLAVYKDSSTNQFVVKDVNGQIEVLSGGGGATTVSGTPNEIVVTPTGSDFKVGIDTVVLNEISTNTSNIATNTTDIATNTENIGSATTTAWCQWLGTINPYFNFTNGSDVIIPFDNFTVSNILGQSLISPIIISPTETVFQVIRSGTYTLGLNLHFFDQFGDLDIFGGLFDNTTGTAIAGIIDQKDVTGNTDSNWYGEIAFNLVAGTTYDFRANFSGGSGQSPFPSTTGVLYTSILIKRLF